jgi:hypothetical protein
MLMRRKFRLALLVAISFNASGSVFATEFDAERTVSAFLALWSKPQIDPADGAKLYSENVDYYGRNRTTRQVIDEKRSIARKIPNRRYFLVPASASETCDTQMARCNVSAVIRWSVTPTDHYGGAATLELSLAREGDRMQIVAERGKVIARCRTAIVTPMQYRRFDSRTYHESCGSFRLGERG